MHISNLVAVSVSGEEWQKLTGSHTLLDAEHSEEMDKKIQVCV